MDDSVAYYTATVQSGQNYIYPKPKVVSTASGARHLNGGTALELPPDYEERITNGMYPVNIPSGWMLAYTVTNIQAVYKERAGKCTAPSAVTLDTAKKVLTIEGGGGGVLNEFRDFAISHRDRKHNAETWEVWSQDHIFTTEREVDVDVSSDKERQFRVRTRGSAGASLYSDYVECVTVLIGNTPPGLPVVETPGDGSATYSTTPIIIVRCTRDNEGGLLTLKRKIDGGEWANAQEVPSGVPAYDKLPALAYGKHRISYKMADSAAAESETASVIIYVKNKQWKREIAPGVVISSRTVKHSNDIKEMVEALNVQRAFYGLPKYELPGKIGSFGMWKAHMEMMQTMISQSFWKARQGSLSGAGGGSTGGVAIGGITVGGEDGNTETILMPSSIEWESVPAYPTASVVNEIRARIKEI